MSAHALTDSERLRASFAMRARRMVDTERRAALIVGGVFLAAASALALLAGESQGLSLTVAALYVVAMAAASEVRVEIGTGFTVPTQAVFVPMMFALPSSLAPLLVALALALAMAPAIITRRAPLSRVLDRARQQLVRDRPRAGADARPRPQPGRALGRARARADRPVHVRLLLERRVANACAAG